MQNYEAQGEIVKGKQQSVRTYCGNLQNNTDVLRSNFSGNTFPNGGVIGQHCYREDLGIEFVYEADGWHECGDKGSTAVEIANARGSHSSLKNRLDVALNADGTLKAGAEVNINEWKDTLSSPVFVSSKAFSVGGDMESVFTKGRALYISDNNGSFVSHVVSSQYNASTDKTSVTISEGTMAVGIEKVAVSVIQYGMPSTIMTDESLDKAKEEIYKHNHTAEKGTQIPTDGLRDGAVTGDKIARGTITAKNLDPSVMGFSAVGNKSTGFKAHIASGMDISVDPATGKPLVKAGRVFLDDTYKDLDKDEVLELQNFRGLVYAEGTEDGVVLKTQEFINPKNSEHIKNIPTGDILFMTDFEIDENNDVKQMIKDLSGNDCNLTVRGKTSDMEIVNPLGWNVPASSLSGKTGWKTADGVISGFKKTETVSFMCAFIPRACEWDNEKDVTKQYIPFSARMYEDGGAERHFAFGVASTKNGDWGNAGSWLLVGKRNFVQDNLNTTALESDKGVFMNKPCLLVYEANPKGQKFYVNGNLVKEFNEEWDSGTPDVSKATIYINGYVDDTLEAKVIPLFACMRKGAWSEFEISEIANQMGIPNEYLGYDVKMPDLGYERNSNLLKGIHCYELDETEGNTIYDSNETKPMHGTLSGAKRINTHVKEGTSLHLDPDAMVTFGSFRLPEEFSFFTCVTLYSDGAIADNLGIETGKPGGFALHVADHKLKLWVGDWVNTESQPWIPFGVPVVVGFTLKNNFAQLYADTSIPVPYNFSDFDLRFKESPLVFGIANNTWKLNADYHKVLMADHAFNDAEIREIFKSMKRRSYKKINDVLGLSDKAVVGMIRTDEEGYLEKVETYPRWGREKNPYDNQKYFLGWFNITRTENRTYMVPNLAGSSCMRVNFYTTPEKNVRTNLISSWTGSSTNWTSYVTSNNVAFNAKFSGDGNFWLGVELEPMAINDQNNNIDY